MMDPRRLLLVEDDPNDRDLFLHALERAGIDVTVDAVESAPDALDRLYRLEDQNVHHRRNMPALILVDVKLLGVNGLQLLQMLRNVRDPHGESLPPVVVFSSSDAPRDVREAYRLGASSFVRKPVQFGRFIEVVQKTVNYWLDVNEPPPEANSDSLFHLVSRRDDESSDST